MKVYYDAYNVICGGDDADNGIGDTINIVPVETLPDSPGDFPVIEVTDEEYQEFLALKNRIVAMQDIFYERSGT